MFCRSIVGLWLCFMWRCVKFVQFLMDKYWRLSCLTLQISVMGKESTLYWIRNICPLKCPSSHKSSKCYRYVKQERVRKGAMPLESPLSRNGSGSKEKRKRAGSGCQWFFTRSKNDAAPHKIATLNGLRLTQSQLWHSYSSTFTKERGGEQLLSV